jgi:hypothetical protein
VSVAAGKMHCVTSATAADYGWIRSSSSPFRYALEIGYTLALVRGVSPAELLTLAGAEPRGVCRPRRADRATPGAHRRIR